MKSKTHDHRRALTDVSAVRQFITAGDATFTLVSKKSDARYTYRVQKSDDGNVHFVSLLIGPSNTEDYCYIGIIKNDEFFGTRKTKIDRASKPFQAFKWFHCWLIRGDMIPLDLEFWHEGKCGRCGRVLTVPESIESGFGPECVKHARSVQHRQMELSV